MNIDHLKAFLEVSITGSFQLAAERLNVTQSTVSARIKVLEDRLDRGLFVRKRTGAELTSAGRQFHRYALTAVRAWEQARQEIALPEPISAIIGLGVHLNLFDILAPGWIKGMRVNAPELGIRVSTAYSDELIRLVHDGFLDLAVVYVPRQRPNLRVELLMDEALVMVTDDAERTVKAGWMEDYIFVDWGEDFRLQHSLAFPESLASRLSVDHGWLALQHILTSGGAAYVLERAARPHIDKGALHIVPDAPVFRRPAYLVRMDDSANPSELALAEDELKRITATIQS